MKSHPKQLDWLTVEEVSQIKADLVEKHSIFKDSDFVNKPDDGIINMFALWDDENEISIYYDLNGVRKFTDIDIYVNPVHDF